jgi:cellulose biosynthesis protein BcsQ
MPGKIMIDGQLIPIVAFYSMQGGVGKSTLARKFAELVTAAPGREGYKPNVLLVDLDVEAEGLTYRLTQGNRQGNKTVHEVMASKNVTGAEAIQVTLRGGSSEDDNSQFRGKLYLMPAAQSDARGLFDTIANIPKEELIKLLLDMLTDLVRRYKISCVVIDCAPAANPYSAAAATLADVPLFIGRNESASYEKIRVLPERFREWYEDFQPANQRVIINAVAARELYEIRAKQFDVFDFIPLTSDVILETEGVTKDIDSLRMMLFDKYIIDIINKVFVGKNHLIPKAPEVVGPKYLEMLDKLPNCDAAPKIRQLKILRHLRWAGVALVVIGIVLIGVHQAFDELPVMMTNIGIICAIVGLILVLGGWHFQSEYNRILTAAQRLVLGGPDGVLQKIMAGVSYRKELEEMRKLAETIPAKAK